jgi:chromosome segregation ATPase
MKLKQLEIKGFKSFADKTILNFDEGCYRYHWPQWLR